MKKQLVKILVHAITTLIAVSVCQFVFAQAEPLLGTVINKAENPLEEVQVVLRAPGTTDVIEEYVTDGEGGFSIPMESLRPGYEIVLNKDGYQEVVLPINPQQLVVAKIRVIMLRTRSETPPTPTPVKEVVKEAEEVWNPSAIDRRERAVRMYNDATAKYEEDVADKEAAKKTAEQMYREAASIDPTFPDPLRILARLSIKRQNWAEASRYSEALIRIDPTDEEAIKNLYISLVIMRHFKRVGEAAKRLISIDIEKIAYVETHAGEFYKNNLFVMSRALYQALTEVAPNAPNAYLNLGLCCAALGDVEATRAAFAKFLELAPEDDGDRETVRRELAKLDAPEALEAPE